MNKARRAQIDAVIKALEGISLPSFEEIISNIETVRDEEQEYLDNMPDSLKEGEKGQNAQAAVDKFEEVIDTLRTLQDTLDEFSAEGVITDLDDAKQ